MQHLLELLKRMLTVRIMNRMWEKGQNLSLIPIIGWKFCVTIGNNRLSSLAQNLLVKSMTCLKFTLWKLNLEKKWVGKTKEGNFWSSISLKKYSVQSKYWNHELVSNDYNDLLKNYNNLVLKGKQFNIKS